VTRKEEKIWVVIEKRDDDTVNAVAYDNVTDAENYCNEMRARAGNPARVRVMETELNRREEPIPFDDAPWGALRIDIKSEFVEGLMEDMVPLDQIMPGAAERFVHDRTDMVRRRTLDKLDVIVKDETREALLSTYEDWVSSKGMED
jgi:hypothetical protein